MKSNRDSAEARADEPPMIFFSDPPPGRRLVGTLAYKRVHTSGGWRAILGGTRTAVLCWPWGSINHDLVDRLEIAETAQDPPDDLPESHPPFVCFGLDILEGELWDWAAEPGHTLIVCTNLHNPRTRLPGDGDLSGLLLSGLTKGKVRSWEGPEDIGPDDFTKARDNESNGPWLREGLPLLSLCTFRVTRPGEITDLPVGVGQVSPDAPPPIRHAEEWELLPQLREAGNRVSSLRTAASPDGDPNSGLLLVGNVVAGGKEGHGAVVFVDIEHLTRSSQVGSLSKTAIQISSMVSRVDKDLPSPGYCWKFHPESHLADGYVLVPGIGELKFSDQHFQFLKALHDGGQGGVPRGKLQEVVGNTSSGYLSTLKQHVCTRKPVGLLPKFAKFLNESIDYRDGLWHLDL